MLGATTALVGVVRDDGDWCAITAPTNVVTGAPSQHYYSTTGAPSQH